MFAEVLQDWLTAYALAWIHHGQAGWQIRGKLQLTPDKAKLAHLLGNFVCYKDWLQATAV